jgi:hypothetical protein
LGASSCDTPFIADQACEAIIQHALTGTSSSWASIVCKLHAQTEEEAEIRCVQWRDPGRYCSRHRKDWTVLAQCILLSGSDALSLGAPSWWQESFRNTALNDKQFDKQFETSNLKQDLKQTSNLDANLKHMGNLSYHADYLQNLHGNL